MSVTPQGSGRAFRPMRVGLPPLPTAHGAYAERRWSPHRHWRPTDPFARRPIVAFQAHTAARADECWHAIAIAACSAG